MKTVEPFPGYTPGDGPETVGGMRVGDLAEQLVQAQGKLKLATDLRRGQRLQQQVQILCVTFNAAAVALRHSGI